MAIKYELSDEHGILSATSPELDPVLCANNRIRVEVDAGYIKPGLGTSDLDAFQRASLEAFIALQGETRFAFEEALILSRTRAGIKLNQSYNVWDQVRVKYLYLPKRKIWTRDSLLRARGWVGELRGVGIDDMQAIDNELSKSDTESTRTRFVIGIQVDWDQEHSPYHAVVRDGDIVAFGFEET